MSRSHPLQDMIVEISGESECASRAISSPKNQSYQTFSLQDGKSRCRVLRLNLGAVPKNARWGYLFGKDPEVCDILLSRNGVGNFAVTFNHYTGLLVLVNYSSNGVRVNGVTMRRREEAMLIAQGTSVGFGDYKFSFYIPNRGNHEKLYAKRLQEYVGNIVLAPNRTTLMDAYTKPISRRSRVGRYFEVMILGKGGFGEVALVANDEGSSYFAAKRFLKNNDTELIEQEIKTLKALSHVSVHRPNSL